MEDLMTLAQIKEALKDKRLYIVAQVTGLSYPTLRKLAEGEESNYTMETLQKVSQYLLGSKVVQA